MRRNAVFWETREVDGEPVLTAPGCILVLLIMPFIAIWAIIRKIFLGRLIILRISKGFARR